MALMDWRTAATKRGFEVVDLAEHVGTRIDSLDLGQDLDEETVAIIRAAAR